MNKKGWGGPNSGGRLNGCYNEGHVTSFASIVGELQSHRSPVDLQRLRSTFYFFYFFPLGLLWRQVFQVSSAAARWSFVSSFVFLIFDFAIFYFILFFLQLFFWSFCHDLGRPWESV